MIELLGIFSLLFHIAWIGMIVSVFGRKIGWVFTISLPLVGALASLVYTFKHWKITKLNEKIFGISYPACFFIVFTILVLDAETSANTSGNQEPILSSETNSLSSSIVNNDQIAAIQNEMKGQMLETNLGYFNLVDLPLEGEWARISDNKLFELVQLTTEAEVVTAVRTTIDSRVPKGEIVWKADFKTGEFKIRVAKDNFKDPKWVDGAVSQLATNVLVVLPLYDGEAHRPFAKGSELEMVYIPKPDNIE